jgi:glycosyltransferase involved in cell wall biosynthesis
MSVPLVTVGIPVQNGARFVADAVTSVLEQTMPAWELVVADNASTDETVAIVECLTRGDPRVRIVRHPRNVGLNANFNSTIAAATTPYVKWLAADDRCGPTFLADAVAALQDTPHLVGVAARTQLIDACGCPCEIPAEIDAAYDDASPVTRVRRLLLDDAFVFVLFGLWRRAVIARAGGLGSYVSADKVLLTELLSAGPVAVLPTRAHFSRCHTGQSLHLPSEAAHGWVTGRPALRRPLHYDRLVAMGGYARAITRAPIGLTERARLMGVLLEFVADRERLARREQHRDLLRAVARPDGVGPLH